jgi:hypothetical protein
MPGTAQRLDAVDRAIEAEADAAFAFLDRLVRVPSTVGHEAGAQRSWPPNWPGSASR